jgi:capsular polysaccharide biosynthesis protein
MIGGDLHDKNSNINQYQERLTKFSSEFELGLFLHIARRSLIWIFLLLIISLFLVFLYLRYEQPIYQSKTTVQINTNNRANKVLNINQIYEEQDPLAGSIEILKSKVFLKRIINNLDLYVSYFNEGTFKSSELYTSTPFIVDINIKNPSLYGKKIYVTFTGKTKGYIERKEKNVANKQIVFTTDEWVNTDGFDFKISCNPIFDKETCFENVQKLSPVYFIKQDENSITANIQSRLDIRLQNELAKTVTISLRDYNPAKAADIVNTIAAEFQQYDIEKESQSSEKVILFINEQLSNVYAQLKQSEDTLETYRKE